MALNLQGYLSRVAKIFNIGMPFPPKQKCRSCCRSRDKTYHVILRHSVQKIPVTVIVYPSVASLMTLWHPTQWVGSKAGGFASFHCRPHKRRVAISAPI